MTQSKQELAAQKARIRAEKLRENLAKRKQQLRGRSAETKQNDDKSAEELASKADKNSLG